MNVLLINTAAEPATVAVAVPPKVLAETTIADRRQLLERLLERLDDLLQQTGLSPTDLAVVGVVTGPGPFTALRLGIATANSLASGAGIPVVSVRLDEAPSLPAFAKLVAERLAAGETHPQATADYGQPPSITLQRPPEE